ncbi:MAG: restriction endonuclease subunit S [Lactobacillus sp.]|nr:restriction endonuclease subunit S [Lactobacillus sp.]
MGKSLSLLKDGTHGSYENVQQGAWLLSAKNIINNRVVITSNDRKISESDFKKIHDKFQLRKGDVLLTIVGTIGRSAILKEANKLTFQRSVAYLRPDENILTSSNFLFSLSKSSNFQNQLKKRTVISAQPGIYLSDIDKLNITIPELKEEQDKIASIIITIDGILSLQQRKLEILIKLKQSFLTKSMANNLDKNPELYFNSASIKWLKQKLSNLTIKEFKGNTKLNDAKPGKTEYLDAKRLNGNAPLFIDKPINTLKSDILILWDGSKAGSVYYGFEGSLGSTLKAIRLNPKLVNSFFVYQQLKSKQDVIFNKYRTPNIPHVIKNFTKIYPIYFPSMAVQNKIARFLGNLDTLIEIQQKSIKDYKVIKKYLLQKLFI